MVGLRNVHAQTVGHRQVVVDLPGVLDERAVLAVHPLCRHVVEGIARRGLIQEVRVVVAGSEIGQPVERVIAVLGATEQVVDLVPLEVDAALDGVVAEEIGAGNEGRPLLGADGILVAILILAQVDRRTLVVVAQVDLHLRLVDRVAGQLLERLVADLGFGREVLAPVIVELQRGVLGQAVLAVPVAVQAHFLGAVALHDGLVLLGVLVGEAGTMVVVDVPVDLAEVALVGQTDRTATQAARLQTERLGRIDHLLQVAGRDLVGGGCTGQRRVQAIGRVRADARGLFLLGGEEEEQLVLDDRPAHGDAAGPVALVAGVVVTAVAAVQPAGVADHLVGIAIGVVHRAVELVGARLGDRIDVGTDRVGGDVEIGGGDVVLADRVDRNRRTLVRQAIGVQAVGVALGNAVDADVVEAVRQAGHRDRTVTLVGHVDARVEARDVVDRTVALRRRLQLALRDVHRQALVVRRENLAERRGGDRDRAEVLGLNPGCAHLHVDRGYLAQLQVDVVLFRLPHARLGHGDVERAAHAQALRGVAAVGVGGDRLGGA